MPVPNKGFTRNTGFSGLQCSKSLCYICTTG